MGKAALILGVVCFALLLLLTMQFAKLKASENSLTEAEKLGSATRTLLQSTGQPCRERDFKGITACIERLVEAATFDLTDFQNFDPRDNTTGAFIITNAGARTYNGSKFVLQKNGVDIETGCHIKTEILPEYSCRFLIKSECVAGDVFAILYRDETPIRILTKTC